MTKDTMLTRWYTHHMAMHGTISMAYNMVKLRRLGMYV
jgi:hypothetical protein